MSESGIVSVLLEIKRYTSLFPAVATAQESKENTTSLDDSLVKKQIDQAVNPAVRIFSIMAKFDM